MSYQHRVENERLRHQLRAALHRAESAEAKLAELEKQEPYGYVAESPCSSGYGGMMHEFSIDRRDAEHDANQAEGFVIELFTRAAPAVSLVELVNDDTKRMDWLVSKVVNVRQPLPYGSRDIFWSQQSSDDCDENYTSDLRDQIDAILRNIEESK